MTRQELLDLHGTTCNKAFSMMEAKNADYTGGSDDPFANFRASEVLGVPAELGILVRCIDKFQRIRSFAVKGELQVKGESVDDAIEDVINYMVLLKGVIKDGAKKLVSAGPEECWEDLDDPDPDCACKVKPAVQDGSERLMTYEEWCGEMVNTKYQKSPITDFTLNPETVRAFHDLNERTSSTQELGESLMRGYKIGDLSE